MAQEQNVRRKFWKIHPSKKTRKRQNCDWNIYSKQYFYNYFPLSFPLDLFHGFKNRTSQWPMMFGNPEQGIRLKPPFHFLLPFSFSPPLPPPPPPLPHLGSRVIWADISANQFCFSRLYCVFIVSFFTYWTSIVICWLWAFEWAAATRPRIRGIAKRKVKWPL